MKRQPEHIYTLHYLYIGNYICTFVSTLMENFLEARHRKTWTTISFLVY